MELFNIIAILLTLAAVFSYINHQYIGLPVSIGVTLMALVMSLGLIVLDAAGVGLAERIQIVLGQINFSDTLLQGMLSFLLFAGALHINVNQLMARKWVIGVLASVGVLLSTFLVAGMSWVLLGWLGLSLPFIYCVLFGALISPTDPIAVLGILKTAGAPKSLEMNIAGESLFNDGVGVVVFLVVMEFASGGSSPHFSDVAVLFLREAIGGGLFGLVVGYIAFWMLRSVDHYQVEILITLALVTGGYALAAALHLSGPIAVVVAGLLIGNHGRLFAMSKETRHHLDIFWELVDEVLNAVLFLLIGLEVLVLSFTGATLAAGLIIIPFVLLARLVTVGLPVSILRPFANFSPGAIRIMTWGGLRGGISVALALSIAPGPARDIILPMTYATVLFSIVVQGLTVEKLVRRTLRKHPAEEDQGVVPVSK